MEPQDIDPFSVEGQAQIAEMFREKYDHLFSILTTMDASRARSLAITNLEQCKLWFEEDQRLKSLDTPVSM